MEALDPLAEIAMLQSKAAGLKFETDIIAKIYNEYPDLKLMKSGDEYIYMSNIAVKSTELYSLSTHRLKSGTCNIHVWPYTWYNDILIRSNPPNVLVAQENQKGFGYVQINGWKEQLASIGLSSKCIKEIQSQLDARQPVNYLD